MTYLDIASQLNNKRARPCVTREAALWSLYDLPIFYLIPLIHGYPGISGVLNRNQGSK